MEVQLRTGYLACADDIDAIGELVQLWRLGVLTVGPDHVGEAVRAAHNFKRLEDLWRQVISHRVAD